MEISLLDLYRIGRNAVQLFPGQSPPKPCLQLQAFRVLQKERGGDITTTNLGVVQSDKDTPFFWSRLWHERKYLPGDLGFNFPILTMFELVNQVEKEPFTPGFRRLYTIELSVLDVFKTDCVDGTKTGCDARPVNQIFLDTEYLLDSVLKYFGATVIATTNADATPRIYYLPWLEAQKIAGAITSFNVIYQLVVSLNTNNKGVRFSRVEYPTPKIYGTKAQIVFSTNNCETISYDTSLEDFGLLSFESGCRDCQ